MTLKKISTDGVGVAVVVDVARQIAALLSRHNVSLGVITVDDAGDPVIGVAPVGAAYGASVHLVPQIWADDLADAPKRSSQKSPRESNGY